MATTCVSLQHTIWPAAALPNHATPLPCVFPKPLPVNVTDAPVRGADRAVQAVPLSRVPLSRLYARSPPLGLLGRASPDRDPIWQGPVYLGLAFVVQRAVDHV